MHSFANGRHQQRGIALLVGLIFLFILSVIAIMAMRGTLSEMKMVTNVARHESAFEASEALRSVPINLFDQHVFARGWPVSLGGVVANTDFDYSSRMSSDFLAKVKTWLQPDCTGAISLFYGTLQGACGTYVAESLYDPTTWHPDMTLSICDSSTATCPANVAATVAVVPDGSVLSEGAGGAQAAGYRGLGVGSAGGGADLIFEVRSVATSPGNGVATTQTQYHQKIQN